MQFCSLQFTSIGLMSMAKCFLPAVFETNSFLRVNVGQLQQCVPQMHTAGGSVERITPYFRSPQSTPPSVEGCPRSSDVEAEVLPGELAQEETATARECLDPVFDLVNTIINTIFINMFIFNLQHKATFTKDIYIYIYNYIYYIIYIYYITLYTYYIICIYT